MPQEAERIDIICPLPRRRCRVPGSRAVRALSSLWRAAVGLSIVHSTSAARGRPFREEKVAATEFASKFGSKASSLTSTSQAVPASSSARSEKKDDLDCGLSADPGPVTSPAGNVDSSKRTHIRRIFKRHELRMRYRHMKKQDALLLQIRKYISALWVCCALSGVYMMASVVSRSQACYFWTKPPTVQWYGALHTIQLLSVAAFTYATLKTSEMKRQARMQVDAATTYRSVDKSARSTKASERHRPSASIHGSEHSAGRWSAADER